MLAEGGTKAKSASTSIQTEEASALFPTHVSLQDAPYADKSVKRIGIVKESREMGLVRSISFLMDQPPSASNLPDLSSLNQETPFEFDFRCL
jgi:hypothetical protein